MIPMWWSILLTVVGVAGLYALTKKKWWGFLIGLSAQALWVGYAVTTKQWGFLGSAVVYGAVNAVGINNWLKSRSDKNV